MKKNTLLEKIYSFSQEELSQLVIKPNGDLVVAMAEGVQVPVFTLRGATIRACGGRIEVTHQSSAAYNGHLTRRISTVATSRGRATIRVDKNGMLYFVLSGWSNQLPDKRALRLALMEWAEEWADTVPAFVTQDVASELDAEWQTGMEAWSRAREERQRQERSLNNKINRILKKTIEMNALCRIETIEPEEVLADRYGGTRRRRRVWVRSVDADLYGAWHTFVWVWSDSPVAGELEPDAVVSVEFTPTTFTGKDGGVKATMRSKIVNVIGKEGGSDEDV